MKRTAVFVLVTGLSCAPIHRAFANDANVVPDRMTEAALQANAAPLDVQAGLREIAAVATQRSAARLGQPGGFYRTPEFHIPLPKAMDKPVDILVKSYASSLTVEVEKAINRAAEATAQPAGDYVLKALPTVTFADPTGALRGPDDAVTDALKTQIGQAFRDAMRPVVRANLAKAGGPAALAAMQARYESLTDRPLMDFDLETYTLESFVTTFFDGIAHEEQSIRSRPSARTTETLRQLFSKD